MAYATGTAIDMAALLTALRNACTANGWTLAGNVLHKDGCYAEVRIGDNGETGAPTGTMLYVRAGNGIDGGNALTDAAEVAAMIGPLRAATGDSWPDWDWPVNYHVHVLADPDEVYLVANYGAGLYWQLLAFGQSPAPGNAGTGNWHHGFTGRINTPNSANQYRRVNRVGITHDGPVVDPGNDVGARSIPIPFWWGARGLGGGTPANTELPSRMHGAVNSVSGDPVWSHRNLPLEGPEDGEGKVSAAVTTRPLLGYSPNTFNNETHLFPIQVLQQRPSSKTSLIGELQHLRICRNDYIDPAGVIVLGGDEWKVYPAYRKNTAARNAANRADHSGTFAFAIRYDGG